MTEKKTSILFLPASIRSHILPSLYLSKTLAKRYEIIYAVTEAVLEDLVKKNGFKTVSISKYKALVGMESLFIAEEQKKKGSLLNISISIKKQELANFRRAELEFICKKIEPHAIFIDIYSSTDYIFLKDICKNIFFLNPMLSTYRVNGFPIVSDSEFLKLKKLNQPKIAIERPKGSIKEWLFNFKNTYLRLSLYKGKLKTLESYDFSVNDLTENNEFTIGFKNIPELVCAPLSLEFSKEIKRPWQHYLGLCTTEHRIDNELDTSFKDEWFAILKRKESKRIIYCSFGTYYSGPDKSLLKFIENLLVVVKGLTNCILVCSVNTYVIQMLQTVIAETKNAYFFTRTQQLLVLKDADIFITHGGLGSVKEAISYEVPMLVYPLDPHYDQNGNALKVEHHGLGLRGNFKYERTEDLLIKINRLLFEPQFALTLQKFNDSIKAHYTQEYTQKLLDTLIK